MRFWDRSLVRVELARVQGTVQALVDSTAISHADYEARLRSLERWRYSVPLSAIAAISSIVALFFHR